jgi:hypothetical protein
MTDKLSAIVQSVLYEGYVLWPYRRTALKNQRRWTFGGVYPRAYSESGHADDAWVMRTECLVEADAGAELDVAVRFLQVVDRRVGELADGEIRYADAITVGGTRHVAWQEAVERELALPTIHVGESVGREVTHQVCIAASERYETLRDVHGRSAGVIVREWDDVSGTVGVGLTQTESGAIHIRVDVTNESAWNGEGREAVHSRTFASTHTVLRARGARFVSLTDPPAEHSVAAVACRNIGTWPVLVGDAPARDTLLSSPIILPDYPEVAPESGGDFFDGAEIDQLLMLSVLSMTPAEQQWMREADPRTREILDRCLSASPDDVRRLHGATRPTAIGGAP